jgi:hypothetical protein
MRGIPMGEIGADETIKIMRSRFMELRGEFNIASKQLDAFMIKFLEINEDILSRFSSFDMFMHLYNIAMYDVIHEEKIKLMAAFNTIKERKNDKKS